MSRDDGSTLPLTIFFGMLSLILLVLVVAATSLYLERKRLFTLADGAALVGAESFELDEVVRTPQGYRPTLTTVGVAAAAEQYVADNGRGFTDLSVERAESVDGRSATVSLASYWQPPLVTLLVPQGLRIEVTVVARAVFF
ncbi:hypothetical protein BH10ACT7_BH10ACT7_32670 [soil metagenome]